MMERVEIERRLTERRALWLAMRDEARTLRGALADPTADPAPAMAAMLRREELTGQLAVMGDPTSEEQAEIDPTLSAIDDEIVALMEEVARLDEESAQAITDAMGDVTREMGAINSGKKAAHGYGDQKKELFARYMSKKL